jgi:hypothetical protein
MSTEPPVKAGALPNLRSRFSRRRRTNNIGDPIGIALRGRLGQRWELQVVRGRVILTERTKTSNRTGLNLFPLQEYDDWQSR